LIAFCSSIMIMWARGGLEVKTKNPNLLINSS
jgi:hypothetical protein